MLGLLSFLATKVPENESCTYAMATIKISSLGLYDVITHIGLFTFNG